MVADKILNNKLNIIQFYGLVRNLKFVRDYRLQPINSKNLIASTTSIFVFFLGLI